LHILSRQSPVCSTSTDGRENVPQRAEQCKPAIESVADCSKRRTHTRTRSSKSRRQARCTLSDYIHSDYMSDGEKRANQTIQQPRATRCKARVTTGEPTTIRRQSWRSRANNPMQDGTVSSSSPWHHQRQRVNNKSSRNKY
jgi:hypothetical protein